MSNIYLPIVIPVSVPAGGIVTMDFSAVGRMGAISLRNAGPNETFLSFDATPPTAAVQTGVVRLQMNEALNLENFAFTTVGFRNAAAQTSVVESVAFQRPGPTSGGGLS